LKINHNENLKYYYTGIGSRKTPDNILKIMTKIAENLAKKNYCLRSGGALRADSAFETGNDIVSGSKEIYYADDANEHLIKFVKQYHPYFHNLSDYAKKLHARNVLQIFGKDLSIYSKFVLCWTSDGYGSDNSITRSRMSGGTGTAIQIALDYKIPVFNLKVLHYTEIIKKIKELEYELS